MSETTYSKAMFSNLVYSEDGEQVATTFIGTEAHYVVMDGDFKRHVPASEIDGQVIGWIKKNAEDNKELVSDQIMNMIGKDDLFTKAMIDSSIGNMEQVMGQGLPDDARMMLGMMGFKIVVNVHGEVVNLEMPGAEMPGDEY